MNNHVKTVCKIGQGSACCRYLTVGSKGFECARITPLKRTIDLRTGMTAQADNCEGKSIEELNTENNV